MWVPGGSEEEACSAWVLGCVLLSGSCRPHILLSSFGWKLVTPLPELFIAAPPLT